MTSGRMQKETVSRARLIQCINGTFIELLIQYAITNIRPSQTTSKNVRFNLCSLKLLVDKLRPNDIS